MTEPTGRRPHFDVQEQIKRIILDRGVPVGGLLPTENDLIEELGVSRGSLREALKGLQARNIISIVHGRGTFVGTMSMDPLIDGLTFHGQLDRQRDDVTTAAELVEIREILESALIRRVAVTVDPAGLSALDAIVADMEATAAEGGSIHGADRAFHERLYHDLDNQLVLQFISAFWEVLNAVRPKLSRGKADVRNEAHLHRLIVEALRAQDPIAAEAAMHAHFRGTHAWIRAAVRLPDIRS
jgi:DNA-binding FadR family transcriptional regulator